MEPLFEAKVTVDSELMVYNIFRLDRKKYRAEVLLKRNDDKDVAAPAELILVKENGCWETTSNFKQLAETLGVEIDAFNNGYGDLLGKIGIR